MMGAESKDPENASFAMLPQGIPTKESFPHAWDLKKYPSLNRGIGRIDYRSPWGCEGQTTGRTS